MKMRHVLLGKLSLLATLVLMSCAAPSAAPPTPSASSSSPPTPVATPKPAPKAENINYAIPSKALAYAAEMFGAQEGIYKEEGLNVSLTLVKSNVAVPAMIAGEIEYVGSIGSSIRGAVIGAPIKGIMFGVTKPSFYLVAKPDNTSVKDLKGKVMGASTPTSSSAFILKDLLRYYGVDPDKETRFVNVGDTGQRLASLEAGAIDATLLTPPFDSLAKKRGYKILAWAGEVGDTPESGLATTDKNIKDKADQVKRTIKATLKSIKAFKENKSKALEFIMKDFNLDRETAEDAHATIAKCYTDDGSASDKAINYLVDQAKTEANIKGDVPVSRAVNFTLLKEVWKEMGLSKQ